MKVLNNTRRLVFLLFLLLFLTESKAQQLFINEILATNSNVNTDEMNEHDDWVELYNATSFPINLGGMFLTDELSNTTKWAFPANTMIPANGYLLIWCDDKEDQGPLHTSFKLSSSGESIALVQSNGTTIIDTYTFGPQTTNVSTGRASNGGSNWLFFNSPTPGLSNTSSGTAPQTNMPVASSSGGHYNNAIAITLSAAELGASIRYTLDGSEPLENSLLYTNPIYLDTTTVIRARTFKTDMAPSRTMTHTYLFNVSHTMPIFCLATDPDHFFGLEEGIYVNWDDDIEQPVHVELYETDGSFGFRQDLGVQIHGGFSQSYPHKGLALIAKNEYGNNKINYPLFPELPFTQYGSFVLRASGNDWSKTMFRDALCANIVRDIADVDDMLKDPDLEFQAYRPTIVYLNGQYFGIHNLREKLDYRYLETHYGIEEGEADIVQRKNKLEHGNLDAWTEYRDFIEAADFTNPADLATLESWIDLGHFTDYFLHNIFIDNNDWPDNNNKGWRLRQEGEKWRYFLYDMDRGFGLIPLYDDYNSGDWTGYSIAMVMADTQTYEHNAEWSTLLLRKLMLNEGFRQNFINRMADFLNTVYMPERLIGRIDSFESIYEPEIIAHGNKWWDTNYYSTNVNKARIFATHRTETMWHHFDSFYVDISGLAELDISAFPVQGGKVRLNTLTLGQQQFPWSGRYFAGVDAPLTAVAQPGYLFSGWTPAALGNNAITTMHLESDESITANFVLGSTQLANVIINEINYHSPDNADAGDWVELFNASDTEVNVSGWFLEDGSGNYFNIPNNSSIPAQGYLVLVEDASRFQNIHPQVSNFVADFGAASLSGNMGLANSGEWISINNADRSYRDTVHYDDQSPWPVAADGQGPSLQLIHFSLDNALASSWVASAIINGTPGRGTQGALDLGADIFSCTPLSMVLDAAFDPCTACNYVWNTGASSSFLNLELSAGEHTFSVTVTDALGTSQSDIIFIQIAAPISYTATLTDILCNGDQTGSISLQSNGTTAYQYLWNNNTTTTEQNNLPAGAYLLTVTDSYPCSVTETFFISEPPLLETSAIGSNPVSGNDGSINLVITGGTAPYTILWSNGSTAQSPANLPAGTYSYVVTDANGCISAGSVELSFSTAVDELSELAIRVFPNPSAGVFYLETVSVAEMEVEVMDLLGRRVWSTVLVAGDSSGRRELDLNGLEEGVYVLVCRVVSDNGGGVNGGGIWFGRVGIFR